MSTPATDPVGVPETTHPPIAKAPPGEGGSDSLLVVLTGNPNCGKTTLFNALTGLRARVGNYAGVTVERKEGRLQGASARHPIVVLDLPGTYSLSPQSLDEQIARDVLLHRLPEVPEPDLIVVVVDASNLERNLYYATQVIELGHPTVIALNLMDVARDNGHLVDAAQLERQLGVAVFPMVASTREGVPALRSRILGLRSQPLTSVASRRFAELPDAFERELTLLAASLSDGATAERGGARAEALLLLTDERGPAAPPGTTSAARAEAVAAARQRLEAAGLDWRSLPIERRYLRVAAIQHAVVQEAEALRETASDRLDRVLTHKVWGMLIFLAIMAIMFQSIFTFARLPMDLLQGGVDRLGHAVGQALPPGDLHSLVEDGVIAGVGAVVVFLPQICLLFLFIGLLEDTGYMARAAFLMDRLMSKVGLHGKSFIPMLSSFACAIPGIMATRTIESPKDRLVTILVAPLMSCSARLPVYTLLIAACIPDRRIFGFLQLTGLTMLGMYLLGIVVALAMAWLFKRTLLQGYTPMLIMELPPYKRPMLRIVLRHMWDRSRLFLRRAGTVILGINILLWFLATYPRSAELDRRVEAQRAGLQDRIAQAATVQDASAWREQLTALERDASGERLRQSFAGRLGRFIEPAIRPLGFDWKIGVGIVTSFAAREVFVSTLSVVYNVANTDPDAATQSLARTLRQQVRADGTPVYTTLTGITLMVFYVLALQCVSTVAVVRRETNGWKWPLFQWAYMGALAWMLGWVTYQGGLWLGFR